MFTEFAEASVVRMVNYSVPDRPFPTVESLNLVLITSSNPDYDFADVSFNLWYRLSEELYHKNDDKVL